MPKGYQSPNGTSIYLPIIKGFSETVGHGYGTAISFGVYRTGTNAFGAAIINLTGDARNSVNFLFDINGNFDAQGKLLAVAILLPGRVYLNQAERYEFTRQITHLHNRI